jgi:cyclopropane-fatty-acyl-phospholipid synthase
MYKAIEKTECSVCGSSFLDQSIDLPNLPLTGVYCDSSKDLSSYLFHDQGLKICLDCGHGQLSKILDPSLIYDKTYFHRSSSSNIAKFGNDCFLDFINLILGDGTVECILEVGANDLYLLNKIKHKAKSAIAVDPIWANDGYPEDVGIAVIGKFIENLEASDLPVKPNVVIAIQTFEHLVDPRGQLLRILEMADDDAICFLEVPGFDALLNSYRFDQIFHQHIQYFSLHSMLRLIQEVGCEYIGHVVNCRYWGGALGVAFKKVKSKNRTKEAIRTLPIPADAVKNAFIHFQFKMTEVMRLAESVSSGKIYGFGAAQMVPTLAYHMNSDFGMLTSILDDNPERANLYYPGLSCKTQLLNEQIVLDDAAVLITAIDSARPILKRLLDLNPQQIINPFNII